MVTHCGQKLISSLDFAKISLENKMIEAGFPRDNDSLAFTVDVAR